MPVSLKLSTSQLIKPVLLNALSARRTHHISNSDRYSNEKSLHRMNQEETDSGQVNHTLLANIIYSKIKEYEKILLKKSWCRRKKMRPATMIKCE